MAGMSLKFDGVASGPIPGLPPVGGDDPTSRSRGGRSSRPFLGNRWARLAVALALLVLLVVLGGGSVGTWLYLRSVEKQVQKVDAFGGLTEEQRPERAAEAALNVLVVGTDASEGGASRTDVIMLAHIPRSGDRAQIISIPRDTWIMIPRSADGSSGGTKAKINAAYAWGGSPLLSAPSRALPGCASTTWC